jgi:hypothetical protein
MTTRTTCDSCDTEIVDYSIITVEAQEREDDFISTFHFCSWPCVAIASASVSGLILSTPDNEAIERVTFAMAETEPPAVSKIRIKKVSEPPRSGSSSFGPITLDSTPLELRREPMDDIPFGGVQRR